MNNINFDAFRYVSSRNNIYEIEINDNKSYIYGIISHSNVMRLRKGDITIIKVGITKNEPGKRMNDVIKTLQRTTGSPEKFYCLFAFEIKYKSSGDNIVHKYMQSLGCVKTEDEKSLDSNAELSRCPGAEWFSCCNLETVFNAIYNSYSKKHDNLTKYFIADTLITGENNIISDTKDTQVVVNQINKLLDIITNDMNKEDSNKIKVIYFSTILEIAKDSDLINLSANEILNNTDFLDNVNKFVNSNFGTYNINIFEIRKNENFENIINYALGVLNDNTLSLTTRYRMIFPLDKDLFGMSLITFTTSLYTNKIYKEKLGKFNITSDTNVLEYRTTIDNISQIIDIMYITYDGAKDKNFYKKCFSNITILIDEDYMHDIWMTAINMLYGKYIDINFDIINIQKISPNIEDFNKFMEDNKKKFDVCLMNPPYPDEGRGQIHLKFVDQSLKCSNNVVAVFPCNFVKDWNAKHSKTYKESFSKRLISVEEINSSIFSGTAMYSVGIYNFGENETAEIYFNFNEKSCTCKSILDYNPFNDNDNEILSYISNNPINAIWAGGVGNIYRKSENDYNKRIQLIEEHCTQLPNDKVYLVANFALGGNTARFFTKNTGKIFTDKQTLIDYFKSLNCSGGYNVLIFDDVISAERCRDAMNRSLFRAMLSKLQVDQNMSISKCYIHIPNINWKDDKAKTDEGILEMCGCPKDKCKEYVDYCISVVEKIDKK